MFAISMVPNIPHGSIGKIQGHSLPKSRHGTIGHYSPSIGYVPSYSQDCATSQNTHTPSLHLNNQQVTRVARITCCCMPCHEIPNMPRIHSQLCHPFILYVFCNITSPLSDSLHLFDLDWISLPPTRKVDRESRTRQTKERPTAHLIAFRLLKHILHNQNPKTTYYIFTCLLFLVGYFLSSLLELVFGQLAPPRSSYEVGSVLSAQRLMRNFHWWLVVHGVFTSNI